jgi:ATP-dependent DNA helicase RecG
MSMDGAPAPALPDAPAPIRAPEALRKKLAKIGLHSEADLLVHLPLRYEDETRITRVIDAPWGEPVQVEVVVQSCEIQYRPRRQMIVRAQDGCGELTLRFFSFYPSQQAALAEGKRIRAFGEVRSGFFGAEMMHPRFHVVTEGDSLPEGLTPVYPTTAGVSSNTLRKLIAAALAAGDLAETLDEPLRQRLKLPGLARTLHFLHSPTIGTAVEALHARNHPAWRRVKFDEVLAQQMCLRRAYLARRQQGAPECWSPRGISSARLLGQLPFGLTGAQQRAVAEIAADLAQPYPMQRLLQGDVGSRQDHRRRTSCLPGDRAGWQAAFMAPTEILAEQHYQKLKAGWSRSASKSPGCRAVSRRLPSARMLASAAAEAQLVVGTHALIQDAVDFAKLGWPSSMSSIASASRSVWPCAEGRRKAPIRTS